MSCAAFGRYAFRVFCTASSIVPDDESCLFEGKCMNRARNESKNDDDESSIHKYRHNVTIELNSRIHAGRTNDKEFFK